MGYVQCSSVQMIHPFKQVDRSRNGVLTRLKQMSNLFSDAFAESLNLYCIRTTLRESQ